MSKSDEIPAETPEVTAANSGSFSFFKGADNYVAPKDGKEFDWEFAAARVREQLGDAMNARNVAFLLGSGCSSFSAGGKELGIPTMAPMAATFLKEVGVDDASPYVSQTEREVLKKSFSLDLSDKNYAGNLERLMEVLFSLQFVLAHSADKALESTSIVVDRITNKVAAHVLRCCSEGPFSNGDETVAGIYQAFYQKLVFRDRALPRPWVFTTNYDLFSETAMDRRGIPYCNGFSGTIERRFNPAVFRYSLAEQLDITSRKWTAVDNFIYLCKLHGSVNWIEDGKTLFPIRELQNIPTNSDGRVLIYPTPAKQNASFASPYAELFREFQQRIVRDQSVLFTLGYSFSDEHINNIIFQALTIPNFRLIAFLPPDASGVPEKLRNLGDPRIWMIGGEGMSSDRKAHYFDTFVDKFMPEPPGNKIDTAVTQVLETLFGRTEKVEDQGGADGV